MGGQASHLLYCFQKYAIMEELGVEMKIKCYYYQFGSSSQTTTCPYYCGDLYNKNKTLLFIADAHSSASNHSWQFGLIIRKHSQGDVSLKTIDSGNTGDHAYDIGLSVTKDGNYICLNKTTSISVRVTLVEFG